MARRFPRNGWRIFKGLTCIGAIFFLLHSSWLFHFASRHYDTWTWTSCPGFSPFERSCINSRTIVAQDLLIVVKTGGSEPQSRLQSQLATILSKVPRENFVIFSDMEEHIGPHQIHDVYADLSKQERLLYPEFALYDAQQEYQRQGNDTRLMKGGWDLAKYMNLAMKRKLWTMQQQAVIQGTTIWRWFVFIDTDTFVEWDNLLGLLEHYDATNRVYIGSPVWLPELQFAHGGSAYVMSHGALNALNNLEPHDREQPMYSQYGLNTTALCCGDEALARALKSRKVGLKGYWPMFNGETPATISFGEDTWCEPVISLHHLDGENMQRLWLWIEEWKLRTKSTHPLLFKDLFQYVAPQLSTVIEDWDNTHESMKIYPRKPASHESFEACKIACGEDRLCFQFVYDGSRCALSHYIRLGKERSPEDNGMQRFTSGWNVERVWDWTARDRCTTAHWVESNP